LLSPPLHSASRSIPPPKGNGKPNTHSTKIKIEFRFNQILYPPSLSVPPTKNQIQPKIPRKPNPDAGKIDGSLLGSARFKAAPNPHASASCFSSRLASTAFCSLTMPLSSSLTWLDERWMLWWYGQSKRRSAEVEISRKREINGMDFLVFINFLDFFLLLKK
jgi:hypothetical protein